MDDQTDDWSRLRTALRQQTRVERGAVSRCRCCARLGAILREGDWQVTADRQTRSHATASKRPRA